MRRGRRQDGLVCGVPATPIPRDVAVKIEEMSEAERMNGFLAQWKEFKAAGNFVVDQEAANKLAAMWKVDPPKVSPPQRYERPPVDRWWDRA